MYKNKNGNFCLVCGDKVIARNFSVFTCESCKAFFRRNAYKAQELNCKFNEKCKITKENRIFCIKCRLNKCFAIGMKKEFIRSNEENKKRRKIIEENYKRKQMTINEDLIQTTVNSFDDKLILCDNNLIDKFIAIDDNELINLIFNCQTYPENHENYIKDETDVRVEDIRQKLIKCTIVSLVCLTDYQGFNNMDINCISELISATNILNRPIIWYKNVINIMNIQDLLRLSKNLTENFIKKAIKFCHLLKPFKSLCIEDQSILIHYGVTEMFTMRNLRYYDNEKQSYICSLDEEITLVIQNKTFQLNKIDYLKVFQKFFDQLITIWNWDQIITDLISVILLLNPNRLNLKHRTIIKYHQQVYIYLLQRYLQYKYQTIGEQKTNFQKLMFLVNDIQVITELQMVYGFEEHKQYNNHYKQLVVNSIQSHNLF